jgi:hypothetical protein
MSPAALAHTLFMSEDSAVCWCSCRKWQHPARQLTAPIGPYVIAANDAHRLHVAVHSAPRQLTIFDPQGGLFA